MFAWTSVQAIFATSGGRTFSRKSKNGYEWKGFCETVWKQKCDWPNRQSVVLGTYAIFETCTAEKMYFLRRKWKMQFCVLSLFLCVGWQGQQETVIIHHLVAKDTIDETVMAALAKKENVQAALMSAVKAKVGGVTA